MGIYVLSVQFFYFLEKKTFSIIGTLGSDWDSNLHGHAEWQTSIETFDSHLRIQVMPPCVCIGKPCICNNISMCGVRYLETCYKSYLLALYGYLGILCGLVDNFFLLSVLAPLLHTK